MLVRFRPVWPLLLCVLAAALALTLFRALDRLPGGEAALVADGAPETIVIGTFNIEFFNMRAQGGREAYTAEDARELARLIRASGADVLALQEIEGDATMAAFVSRFLPGWDFAGNDTDGTQDLYFLWDTRKVALDEGLAVRALSLLTGRKRLLLSYFGNTSYEWDGRRARRFDRMPLLAVFRTPAGKKFSLLNVHLKSQLVTGADKAAGRARNNAKRGAQIASLNELCDRHSADSGPLFILGDYNEDVSSPAGQTRFSFPLRFLTDGHSYDNMKNNLDFIGCRGISMDRVGPARETEARIERRSQPGKDHPDHDIITVEVRL